MKYTYTDVTKKMCAVCGKPHGPGKKFCPGSVRSSRLLIPVKNGAEEMLMTSDEVCRRCRHSFAKKRRAV